METGQKVVECGRREKRGGGTDEGRVKRWLDTPEVLVESSGYGGDVDV
jgi:hypothetical protein